MWKQATLLGAVVVISSCASQYGPDSPYYNIPVSSKIKVLKQFKIPPNTAHVTFQYGKIVNDNEMNAVDFWYTNCRFEVNTLGSTYQTVKPDTFSIKKIESSSYAASGRSVVNFYTKFYLHSEKSPNVLYLTCAQYDGPTDFDYPSIPQMRKAWGDYLDIVLPADATKADDKKSK
ncbi:MAG: hypothetical protein LJE74_11915 [Proteobacteria bacterium]|jgi:hypothetical protein|nr:hypothetical protein [Pseudomonadota bacterium]